MRTFRASSPPAKAQRSYPAVLPRWKRTLDLSFCCAALPILAFATFFVAILMSVASPGPIFFRQERVGHLGRRFRLYKFRTMHVGADTSNHQAYFTTLMASNAPMQKLDANGDTRLIPFGWFIRALGLDELPQIINVFTGEMSMVGPRPCIPYEYDKYSFSQRARFDAVPGLTGLWQVSGKNRTTFDRMIQLDVEYAAKRSLALDMKIVIKTVPAMLAHFADICRARQGAVASPKSASHTNNERKNLEIAKPPPIHAS